MPRQARIAPGGYVYHVLNRAAGRVIMHRHDDDFLAFEHVLAEAMRRHSMRLLSYCLMGNHWHFVVRPQKDGDLTSFFRWLTHTHAMRWRVAHGTVGYGPLYRGRFKCFPVEQDAHFLTVCRYVERNPLGAKLVKRAQDWRWSSLWVRENGTDEQRSLLSDWPVERPANWTKQVNAPWAPQELARLHTVRDRGRPFGSEAWTTHVASRIGLQHTLRPEGRPPKSESKT